MGWRRTLAIVLAMAFVFGTQVSLSKRRRDQEGYLLGYWHVGCYKDDRSSRALPIVFFMEQEGIATDSQGDWCANKTWSLGYSAFGIQYQKECWTGPNATLTYDRYGKPGMCHNGLGGDWANDIYFLNVYTKSSERTAVLRCYQMNATFLYNIPADVIVTDTIARNMLQSMLRIVSTFLGAFSRCKDVHLNLSDIHVFSTAGSNIVEIRPTLLFTAHENMSRENVNSVLKSCTQLAKSNEGFISSVSVLQISGATYYPYTGKLKHGRSCCGAAIPPPCCTAGAYEVVRGSCACLAGYGRESGRGRDGRDCERCPVDTYQDGSKQKCKKCPGRTSTWGRTGVTSKRHCTDASPIIVSSLEATVLYGLPAGSVVARVWATIQSGSLVIPPLEYKITMVSDQANSRGMNDHSDSDKYFKIDSITGNISVTEEFKFIEGMVYTLDVRVSDSANSTLGSITNTATVRLLCKDVCKKSRELYKKVTDVCPAVNITRLKRGENTPNMVMNVSNINVIYEVRLHKVLGPGNYSLHMENGNANFTILIHSQGREVVVRWSTVSDSKIITVRGPTLRIILSKGDTALPLNTSEGVTVVGIPKAVDCKSVSDSCLSDLVEWKVEVNGTGESFCEKDNKMIYRTYDMCIGSPTVSISQDAPPSAAGSQVTFRCQVTSRIDYTVQWYRNGQPIQGAATAVYTLTAMVDNQGYYKCVATSLAGESASDEILLKVPDFFTSYVLFRTRKKNQVLNEIARKVQEYLSTQSDMANRYTVVGVRSTNKGRDVVLAVYGKKTNNENITVFHQHVKTSIINGRKTDLKKLKIKKKTVKIRSAEYCLPETTGKSNIKGEFKWQLTRTQIWSWPVSCPYNTGSTARRWCRGRFDSGGEWDVPNDGVCKYASQRTQELDDMSKKKIDTSNAKETADKLKDVVSKTPAKELNEADAALIADTLTNLVGSKETLNKTADVIVEVVSTIMDMDRAVLASSQEASTKIISALDNLAGTMPMVEGENSMRLISPLLLIEMEQIDGNFNGTSFADNNSASVVLPNVLFNNVSSGTHRLGIMSFVNNNLFIENEENDLDDDEEEGYRTSDAVLSCSVYNTSINNLTTPLVLTFPKPKTNKPLVPKKCVYWGKKNRVWLSDGCNLRDSGSCACDHMTSFAVIFSPPGQVTRAPDHPLTILSYVGCAISLVGVLLTLITFSLFRHLRKTNQQPIIINICIALGLLLIVFLAGAGRPESRVGCKIVAVLLHYLTLAVVMWMGVEGYNLYLQIIQVMATYQRRFMFKAALVAWGLPVLIVGVTVVVVGVEEKDRGDALYYYGNDTICVLFEPVYYWVSWFAPVLLILLVNIVIYALVVHKLGCTGAMVNTEKKSTQRYRLRTSLAIMCLLGLTWIFGALSFGHKYQRLVFEYLFCIFNSLQGVFIFIFHCVRIKEVRNQWRFFLSGHGISFKGTSDSFQRSKGIGESQHSSQAPYAKVKHYISTRSSDRVPRKDTLSTIVGPNNSVGDPKDVCDEADVRLHELGPLEAEKDNVGLEGSEAARKRDSAFD